MARDPAGRRSLCRCPGCSSFLLQTTGTAAGRTYETGREVDDLLLLVGIALIDRSCPECGYRDTVGTSSLDAATAYRLETRRLLALQQLADSIADAIPVVSSERSRS